ncbi:thioredoxin-disulfide reductase [Candidatus Bathyarchaeota archaeon]|nr:thioredoxin-disulfide reductase [Candidatus Bathyarchaeota archaeon]
MEDCDLIIIGAGPAGLAAGIYATRSGLKTLVLEEKIAGGTIADAPLVENYPGLMKVTGLELAQKMAEHSKLAGVKIHEFEGATKLELKDEIKTVKTGRAAYQTRTVVIASGSHYREIGVPGEREFRGRGVSYCGICDGPLFKDKRVLVVGGGNSALITTLYLSELAAEVKIAHRRDVFRAEEALVKALANRKNIEVLWSREVQAIQGEKTVNKVVFYNKKSEAKEELSVDGVFVQVGESPNSQLAKEAGVEVDEHGYIKVDMFQKTNIAGVYAAGDVTNHPVKQVGTAVGQGIAAALEAYAFVKRPYYK